MILLVKLSLLLVVATTFISAREEGTFGYGPIVNPFVCTPGTRFKVDCNTCTCGLGEGNVGACTRMGCILKPDECIPGTYFQISGQLCKCPNCGYKWHSNCFANNFCLH